MSVNPIDLDPKDFVAVLEILKKIDFLAGVPEDELKGILFALQKQVFPAGKTILFQGEIANRLFIVRSGEIQITTKSKGQKIPLATLKAGQYFGEISLLRPLSATATATTGEGEAEVVILTHDTMSDLSKRIPDIEARIQRIIDQRLAQKDKANQTEEAGASS